MESNIENEFKNIVDDWTNENADTITKGMDIQSPGEMLKFERTLMILLIQLGALIMAWIIKTRVEDRNFQKMAAQEVITSRPKKTQVYKIRFY